MPILDIVLQEFASPYQSRLVHGDIAFGKKLAELMLKVLGKRGAFGAAADAAAGDQFGSYVAIAGDTVVIIGGGSAYVFEDESSWWDYFSSKAKRPLPPAMVLLVAMLAL